MSKFIANTSFDNVTKLKVYNIIKTEKFTHEFDYSEFDEGIVKVEYIKFYYLDDDNRQCWLTFNITDGEWDDSDIDVTLFDSDKEVLDHLIKLYNLDV